MRDMTEPIDHKCPSINVDSGIALYNASLERHPETENVYVITSNACYYYNKKLREWWKA